MIKESTTILQILEFHLKIIKFNELKIQSIQKIHFLVFLSILKYVKIIKSFNLFVTNEISSTIFPRNDLSSQKFLFVNLSSCKLVKRLLLKHIRL